MSIKNSQFFKILGALLKHWACYNHLKLKNKKGVGGISYEPHQHNFQNQYNFERCWNVINNDILVYLLSFEFQKFSMSHSFMYFSGSWSRIKGSKALLGRIMPFIMFMIASYIFFNLSMRFLLNIRALL